MGLPMLKVISEQKETQKPGRESVQVNQCSLLNQPKQAVEGSDGLSRYSLSEGRGLIEKRENPPAETETYRQVTVITDRWWLFILVYP